MRNFGVRHYFRMAHDYEERLLGPNGEPVIAMEVLTYKPRHHPPRTDPPPTMILRFEHHDLEIVEILINKRGIPDLRQRGPGDHSRRIQQGIGVHPRYRLTA